MASMKDAWDECVFENHAMVKFLIAAAPVFGAIYFYQADPQNMSLVYIFASISAIISLITRILTNLSISES